MTIPLHLIETKYFMKKINLLVLVLLSIQSFAQPTPPEGQTWEIVESMTDEFNGDSIDRGKWFNSDWPYENTPSVMSLGPENSFIEDGKLCIRATLRDHPKEWFQSARIHSTTKISYPMYTECSMLTSEISAYNTFWLNNGDGMDRDEIDVVENNSHPSCGCQPDFPTKMNSQYFQVDQNLDPKIARNHSNFNSNNLSDDNPLKGVPWNEAYHTVGVWWKDAQNIQFYLDGEPAGSVRVGEQRFNAPFIEGRMFTRDLQLIWDMWTADQPWLGGLPQQSQLNDNTINTMRVDWVHTYKLKRIGEIDDRAKSISWDNANDFIVEGESRPIFEPGETVSITTTHASSIVSGNEADFDYVAMHIRELDENGAVVSTSPFADPVGTNSPNAATTTFNFTIPTNFDASTPIPTIENLDKDHRIILLIYTQENADPMSLIDTNTEIVLTNNKTAFIETLSIDDVKANNTTAVYPNPFKDTIILDSNSSIESWELFDLNGKLLNKGASSTIVGSNLNAGLYILVVNDKEVIKIIKE